MASGARGGAARIGPSLPRIVRGSWGAVLLVAPDRLLRAGGGRDTPAVRVAVRILGARHLVEAAVLARARGRRPLRWIICIDLAHCASMMALAAVSPAMRRDALLSAASACGLVALSVVEH